MQNYITSRSLPGKIVKVPEFKIKKLIHHSNLIEGYDDDRFDHASFEAWLWLMSIHLGELTHNHIHKLQAMITAFQDDLDPRDRGNYRDTAVRIGSHIAPAPHLVQYLMDNWLLDYKDMDPIQAHIRFEKIHPFIDGNGRTGRLLLWWMQAKQDLPLSIITYDKRMDYYRWFSE